VISKAVCSTLFKGEAALTLAHWLLLPGMQELIGWASSAILLLTISSQIYRQWKEGSSKGVSKWLFIGQVAASVGFTVYSLLVKNWVFVFTNALILLSAVVGVAITLHHKRTGKGGG
jgi:MtN3 and saliva related transmembrane protein